MVNWMHHPKPETVWPIRVRAGAFGGNVPQRDLYLSPDHAVFVKDVLVPVRLLINGTSVARVTTDSVRYFHVELPHPAVILANGLPVASYLDIGDRGNFHRGAETIRLFPEFAARLAAENAFLWETRGAAPLVVMGEKLAAVRRMIAETAKSGLSRMGASGGNQRLRSATGSQAVSPEMAQSSVAQPEWVAA